uniref:Uncharacterized protein n=1 Tax=Panagrolaimus sp. ES5 TaxID=591445 RepID=A0AC34F014_9BILA
MDTTPGKIQYNLSVFIHRSSQQQNFDFRTSTLNYILKNPKSPEIWKKLVHTCKWFFDKNSIVVLPCLHYDFYSSHEVCMICSDENCNYRCDRLNNLSNVPFKLWITQKLDIEGNKEYTNFAERLYPFIFKCDATTITLCNKVLSFKEFLFLTHDANDVSIATLINDENGKTVPFEKIVENLPKLKIIY